MKALIYAQALNRLTNEIEVANDETDPEQGQVATPWIKKLS
ncbi:hypothetical protein [Rothia sp. ZJ932]|nr:hypothetical protein [Rothia sp. ZJ932]